MAPASIGPVKTMILALNAGRAAKVVDDLLKKGTTDIRGRLDSFAKSEGIEA
jgi:phosphotransferase system enzyme I (PtsP)